MIGPAAPPADAGTRLAIDRTRLAYERTMMAWVRTATSLISFGFTIHKFFQFQMERGGLAGGRLIGPREFALLMIGTGLVALLLSTIQHRQSMKTLAAAYGPQPRSLAAVVAALISALGLLAFFATLFHM